MDLETENRIASVHNHRNVDHGDYDSPDAENMHLTRSSLEAPHAFPEIHLRLLAAKASPFTEEERSPLVLQGLDVSLYDVTAVELVDSLPLVRRADPHNLPFFDGAFDFTFTAHLDDALFPWRVVEEMERTVRRGRFCVVAVDECGGDDVREIARLFLKSKLVDVAIVTLEGSERTSILLKVQDF
ncbi:unnamed protein product [Brassica rapa subsp. narinosa]